MSMRIFSLGVAAFGASIALAAPAGASADNMREDRCDVQARAGHDLQTVEMRDLHVLTQTASAAQFAPALPSGAQAIVCVRNSIIPAAHDDKVLALGIPLIIAETTRPHRMGVLEINDGRLPLPPDGRHPPRRRPGRGPGPAGGISRQGRAGELSRTRRPSSQPSPASGRRGAPPLLF
jgi:hypothetical protein